MRKIVEYSIVRGFSPSILIRNMSLALKDGFQPFGAPVYYPLTQEILQSVVLYEEEVPILGESAVIQP